MNQTSMKERIARAIELAIKRQADCWIQLDTGKHFIEGDIRLDEVAESVLDAMREPTNAMLIDAGRVDGYGDDTVPWSQSDKHHIEWWRDMIDAAKAGEQNR